MKQPDETPTGARKTLLKRESRKPAKNPKKKSILDKDVEEELVKEFGNK